MIAEIVSIGTELLLGQIINTNAAFLARELAAVGIFTYFSSTVGDNPTRLKDTLHTALRRSDIVITTGGLGPTYDDLTKETVAELLRLEMVTDEHSLERISSFFKKLNRTMPESNTKQAKMPRGANVLDNNCGTAPGLILKTGANPIYKDKIIVMLPGPPREMQAMFLEKVKPFFVTHFTTFTLHSNIIHIFGLGESAVEEKLYDLMLQSTNPTIAPYAKQGEVELRVTASGSSIEDCEAIMAPTMKQIQAVLGNAIYGINIGSLQAKVVECLTNHKLTLAVAESCTGGYITQRITSIPGASNVFLGGVIAYSNAVKQDLLGVAPATLDSFGAVSWQVAQDMARGVALKLNSDIGIAVTGIASKIENSEKPVGLVFIGYYDRRSGMNNAIELQLARGQNDEREHIRYLASSNALYEIIKNIEELWK